MDMMWLVVIATFILFSLFIYFLALFLNWFFSSNLRRVLFSLTTFICLIVLYGIHFTDVLKRNLIFAGCGLSIFLLLSYIIYITIKNQDYYDKHFEGEYYYELPADYTPAEMSILFMNPNPKDLAATLLDLVRKKIISITFIPKNNDNDYEYKIELTDNAIEINEPILDLDTKTSLKKEKQLNKDLNINSLHLGLSMITAEKLANKDLKRLKGLNGLTSFLGQIKNIKKELKDLTSFLERIKSGAAKISKNAYSKYKRYKNLKPHENYLINWFINLIGDSKMVYLSDIANQEKFDNYSFIKCYEGWLNELDSTANKNNNFFIRYAPFMLYGKYCGRTKESQLEYEKWLAFKRYLENLGDLKSNKMESVILFEQYLAYAVSLGIEWQVLKNIKLKFSPETLKDKRLTLISSLNSLDDILDFIDDIEDIIGKAKRKRLLRSSFFRRRW